MKTIKYQINFKDNTTGATSAIDTIEATTGYTADDYIRDCQENADDEWCKMLENGTVTIEQIEEEEKLFEGFKDGQKIIVTLEDGYVWIMTNGEKHRWNDELYDSDSYSLIRHSLLAEGYQI